VAVRNLAVNVAYVTKGIVDAWGVAVAGWQWCQSTQRISAVRMVVVTRWQWQYWPRYWCGNTHLHRHPLVAPANSPERELEEGLHVHAQPVVVAGGWQWLGWQWLGGSGWGGSGWGGSGSGSVSPVAVAVGWVAVVQWQWFSVNSVKFQCHQCQWQWLGGSGSGSGPENREFHIKNINVQIKNINFHIKNINFHIKIDVFHIKNINLHIKIHEFPTKNINFHIKNHEFHIKNTNLHIKIDVFHSKKAEKLTAGPPAQGTRRPKVAAGEKNGIFSYENATKMIKNRQKWLKMWRKRFKNERKMNKIATKMNKMRQKMSKNK
jgi:hypothetical protein